MGDNADKIRGGVVLLPSGAILDGSTQKTDLTPVDLSSEGFSPKASLHLLQHASFAAIVEIMHFGPQFGSWMYTSAEEGQAPEMEEKGTMSFVTTIDPLFCSLALLEHRRKEAGNMFQSLDDMLHSDHIPNFRKLCPPEQAELICEVKRAGEESFYRLSDEKVFLWLECKLDNLQKASKLARNAAIAVLSQYLSEPWDTKFAKKFEEKVAEKGAGESSGLNAAQEVALGAILDDARKQNEEAEMDDVRPKDAPPVKKRKTTTKKVARPMTSFFKKKPKCCKEAERKKEECPK